MPARPALAIFSLTALLLTAYGKDSGSSSTAPATSAAATTSAPAGTVAAPPPATATATATASAAATGGACSFAGEWTGNYPPGPYPFSGKPFDFTFNADGTGITDSARAKTEVAWKTEGGTFSIHGVKDVRPGRFTCAKDEVGKFGFTFTSDCNTVTMKLQQDPCKGRGKTVDGLSMKRK